MDLVTLAFLALIALVSGGIAYFADWLGRHLGKKRLRLAGLRPRHTAGVFVVASGIVISLLTIGIVSFLSSDVRQWIREGRLAIRELNQALAQRDSATAENAKILKQNDALKAESQRRQAEIDKAEGTLKTITLKTKDLQAQNLRYQSAAVELTQRLNAVQTKFLASTQSLQSTEAQRKQVEASLKNVSTQFIALNGRYHTLNQSWAELSRQSKEIEQYNIRLTDENTHLTSTNTDLEAKGKDLQAKNDDAARALDLQKREIDRQTEELKNNATILRTDEQYLAKLDTLVSSSRERPMTFAAHQELARVYLPARQSQQAARDAITSLLRDARTEAEKRGAKSTGTDTSCARIFPHEDLKSGREIKPAEIVDALVHRVSGRPTELVLVATSSLNAFEGEPVSVDVKDYPNPLVYKQGQVLAEIHLDRTEDVNMILTRINSLLRQKVHERAKKDNLIPAADDSFGNVDGVEVYKIANELKSAGRPVRLQAVTRMDTRAGDPLQIELRIR